jgi:hypothetical protein
MVSNDPPGPRSGPTGEPGPAEDALTRLEERLERASQAAERLIADAAERAADKAPPAGWQRPRSEDDRQGPNPRVAGDIELLLGLLHSLGELIPSELQRRLAEALREVLLALRALIDWYLERAEVRRAEPVEVQDIPIM